MLLAIETSSRPGSVALFASGELIDARTIDGDQSGGLAAAIESMTKGRLGAIEHFAIGIGPGSFTGLRMGLALLKGIALVFPRPAIAVSSFETLAHQAAAEHETPVDWIASVLDARNGEVYAGLYAPVGRASARLTPGLHAAADVARLLSELEGPGCVVGDGAGLVASQAHRRASESAGRARAATVGRLAWPRAQAGEGVEVLHLEPAYHQRPAAERKRKAGST